MREIVLNETEKEFFSQLKTFLLEAKLNNLNFDIVSFYQAILERKEELQGIIDYCEDITTFKYKAEDIKDHMKCSEVVYIFPRYFTGYFSIELSWYVDQKIIITKHESCYEDYIYLNDELNQKLIKEFESNLEIHKKLQAKKELSDIEKQIEELNKIRYNLLKEVS